MYSLSSLKEKKNHIILHFSKIIININIFIFIDSYEIPKLLNILLYQKDTWKEKFNQIQFFCATR